MKRKGFTLIELLAVIVILAIIALISTPMILGIIEKSKKGAAQDSAYMYLDAVSQYMIVQEIKDTPSLLDGLYYVSEDTDYESSNIKSDILLNNIIKIKGKYPTDGYVEILNGKINDALLVFNDYEVTCNENIQCIVGDKVSFGLKKIILSTEIEDYTKLEENQIFKINISTIPENIEEEFTYTSSDNDIATVDENGNVKVIKKGNVKITVTASNGKTAELYVYMVEPEKPEISTDGGYPLITSHGISYSNKISIKYDEIRNDITNYYSVDNEQTWIKYDGPFTAYNSVISAKSVVNSTGKEVITSNVKINVATDALPAEAYDGDETTIVNFAGNGPKEYFVDISPEMYENSITLLLSMGHYTTYGVKYYDKDNNEIGNVLQSGNVNNTKLKYTIKSGTAKMGIYYSSNNSQDWGKLFEVSLNDIPVITETKNYPNINVNGIIKGNNEVTIKYFLTTIKKLYRINSGKWQEYQDEPIILEIDDKLEAKGSYSNGKESEVLDYTSQLSDDALPAEAYDGDETTIVNFAGNGPKEYFVDISPEMYEKEITLLLSMGHGTTYGVKYYDKDNNEIGSVLQSGNVNNTKLKYTIKSGTAKMGIYYSSNNSQDWGKLFEVSVSNS